MAANKAISIRYLVEALDSSMARIEFAPDGTIIDANRNFTEVMGYSLEEIRGRNHSIFVDEATRSSREYKDLWDQLRAGKFQSGEFCRLTKSGKAVFLQATYNPVSDQRGNTVGVVKFAVDVTAAVEAKLADQKLQQLYSQMVENTSVRLIVADRNGTITVIKDSPTLEVVATNAVGEPIDATPAPEGRDLFLRSERSLICVRH